MCALLGVALLAMRMRHAAVFAAILGILVLFREGGLATLHAEPHTRCARCSRRNRRSTAAETFEPPTPVEEPSRPEPEAVEDDDGPNVAASSEDDVDSRPPASGDPWGEVVAEHTGIPARLRRTTTIRSPDLQRMDRERLPVAMLSDARRMRLRRIQGKPTHAAYRSTTGQTSRFAHLR